MNYKNLFDHEHITDIRDNESGHFTQKCPFCFSTEMQINARENWAMCHNVRCKQYHKKWSIGEIDSALRKL
jgi:hypothetical protein